MTYYEAATRARDTLVQAGIRAETAQRDAELLARHTIGWDLATWLARRLEAADGGFITSFASVIERRRAREPVAYIRGVQEFWGRDFRVTSAVLIPRPETELLLETANVHLRAHPTATVVDLGTGSGCLAISMALEHPAATVYATDISAPALAIATENAARWRASHVRFVHGAYFASVPPPVDLVVTNPPYVAGRDEPGLMSEVKDHEPAEALFGGEDGWRDIRAIFRDAPSMLRDEGRLMMEFGYGQLDQLEQEIASAGTLSIEDVRNDLQGIPRVAIIRRTPSSTTVR